MAHVPSPALPRFERGKPLAAAALNERFDAIQAHLETLAIEARSPDPAVVPLELRAAALEKSVRELQHLTSMHARQRNEKEWAPLAHIGAMLVMINDLRRDMEKSLDKVTIIADELHGMNDDLHRRLTRLEQRPDYATAEEVAPLAADYRRLALKEHMLLAQVMAIRNEMSMLREIALGRDREANRKEYAPLSYIGHILQRLNAIEVKLG